MPDPTRQRTVLVTGATGKVGGAIIDLLRDDPSLRLRAGMRDPGRGTVAGVQAVWLDYDRPESVLPALEGVDTAFLATGYTVDMLRQSKAFIDAGRHAGLKRMVHLGACGDDDAQVDHWAWHQLVERYIEWAGFGFTHLRPEFFMQNLLGYGRRSPVADGVITGYVGDARASWVDCDDVAAVAAECLRRPERHAGQTYRLGYDAKSYGEIAAILTDVVGRPFTYRSLPPDAFLAAVTAAGSEPAYMRSVHRSHVDAAADRIPDPAPVFDNFEALTGRKPATWRDFAARHRDAFAGRG